MVYKGSIFNNFYLEGCGSLKRTYFMLVLNKKVFFVQFLFRDDLVVQMGLIFNNLLFLRTLCLDRTDLDDSCSGGYDSLVRTNFGHFLHLEDVVVLKFWVIFNFLDLVSVLVYEYAN